MHYAKGASMKLIEMIEGEKAPEPVLAALREAMYAFWDTFGYALQSVKQYGMPVRTAARAYRVSRIHLRKRIRRDAYRQRRGQL